MQLQWFFQEAYWCVRLLKPQIYMKHSICLLCKSLKQSCFKWVIFVDHVPWTDSGIYPWVRHSSALWYIYARVASTAFHIHLIITTYVMNIHEPKLPKWLSCQKMAESPFKRVGKLLKPFYRVWNLESRKKWVKEYISCKDFMPIKSAGVRYLNVNNVNVDCWLPWKLLIKSTS